MQELIAPPRRRLLVFAELPESGNESDETRLGDLIGAIGESSPDLEIEFVWAPTPDANGAALRRAFGHHATAMQTGTTHSDRLSMAFSERFYFHRTETIIAIGVDDRALPRTLLDQAFELLDSVEWVIGPDAAGGCYLVGCRALAFDCSVFDGIAWDTPGVLAGLVERIGRLQATVALLPERRADAALDFERYRSERT